MLIYLAMIGSDEDKSKFEQIYEGYRKQIHRVAFDILQDDRWAEDAVHDAFLRLIPRLSMFEDVNSLKTRRYILLTAESAAIDLYRKLFGREADKISFEELSDEVPADTDSGGVQELAALIDQLPPNYSVIIKYKCAHGLSDREIAKELSITEANVRKRFERAKKALAKLMEEEAKANT